MVQFLAVDNNLSSTELLVMLAVEYLGNSTENKFVVGSIAELINSFRIHEEPLKSWDERKIAEQPTRLAGGIEAGFFTELAV